MTPPAFVPHNQLPTLAPQHNDQTEKDTANSLVRIFTYTPIPTIILNSSLRVVEVSNSFICLFSLDRDRVLGSLLFDLYEMPASRLPIILGVLNSTIFTRSIQVTESPWCKGERLQITPIFDGPMLLYLALELQSASSIKNYQ
jgi:osomolarity two-component system sensor histidine kinase TcsA